MMETATLRATQEVDAPALLHSPSPVLEWIRRIQQVKEKDRGTTVVREPHVVDKNEDHAVERPRVLVGV
jgi:hypothetical protein